MSVTAIHKSPREILAQAAPLAEQMLDLGEDHSVGVVLMALMLGQIEVADQHNFSKETVYKLFDELWNARELYDKMLREAH